MSKLLATTESEPDSEKSYKTLSLVAFTRGEDGSKTKAIEQLLASVDANPDTERTIDCLALFATRGEDEHKSKAIGKLIENHVNHDKMIDVMQAMSRGLPARQTEQRLQQISEAAVAGKVKGNAIIARISMLNRLKGLKSFLASADEEQLERYDPEVIEYVNAERDADELKNLENLLETFISDHSGVLKKAERELYAMQHLSVGCEAPDITGIDLDGEEFSLSDYRGKVVFLDFWGDW